MEQKNHLAYNSPAVKAQGKYLGFSTRKHSEPHKPEQRLGEGGWESRQQRKDFGRTPETDSWGTEGAHCDALFHSNKDKGHLVRGGCLHRLHTCGDFWQYIRSNWNNIVPMM